MEPSASQVLDGNYRESFYLAAFPDIAAAVNAGDFPSGLAHFLHIGRSEMLTGSRLMPAAFKRAPVASGTLPTRVCRLFFGDNSRDFDEQLYTALFPDVVTDGTAVSAFNHWLEHGFGELASGSRSIGFVPPATETTPSMLSVEWGVAEQRIIFPGVLPQPDASNRVDVAQFRRVQFDRLMARPFGINVFGPFAMESGLGTIARGIIAALRAIEIPVDLWPYDTMQGWRTLPKAERLPQYRINLLLANADTTQNLMAIFPSGTFDDAYSVALWQWEMASMRPDAVLALGNIDEIWTSSTFECHAIAAISPVPVLVVPPPVRPYRFAGVDRWTHPAINDDTFVFMAMLDMASRLQRKNVTAAIDAFAEVDAPQAILLVKLYGDDPDPENITLLRQLVTRHTHLILLDEVMTEHDLARLRARVDCLLSPHRSEGFGLNIAEFLALGKPVIATGYSGNADFFDATVGYPIEYDLVELATAVAPYPAGYVWAEPRRTSLVAQIREVMADPGKRRQLGEAASARMAGYTAVRAGDVIAARLDKLGLRAPLPPFMAVANGAQRMLTRQAAPGGVFSGPTFSVPVIVNDAVAGAAMLSAMSAQVNGGWELLLRAAESASSDVLNWLERTRGCSPRVRILQEGGPGLTEAATCRFVLFVVDAGSLDRMVLANASAVLSVEPAYDGVMRAPGLLVVRKSLLLTMGERDLSPLDALDTVFTRTLAGHTRLIRRLDPL